MQTDWDYTALARAYLKRPDYAEAAVRSLLGLTGVRPGDEVCDVGAGVAHLTLHLARFGLCVSAVEPNSAMRELGAARTSAYVDVAWHEGTGEKTGQPGRHFSLVTFGSSFNVCDRAAALVETARILGPGGWFACLWNHRDLEDPLQAGIEALIAARVPGYRYGTRREDQSAVIAASGLFEAVQQIEARVVRAQPVAECLEAWASHATLSRQAGPEFSAVLAAIRALVEERGEDPIRVPYTTRVFAARLAGASEPAS